MASLVWTTVRSSFIRRIALQGSRAPYILRLHLKSGYYAYRVPGGIFERLIAAPSKGTFYGMYIKGKFPRV